MSGPSDYILEENVGFVLRQVTQRHLAIFSERICDELTPTQFSALNKLLEAGPCSQGKLGRLTAMDRATIKGVIDRLSKRGLTRTEPDPEDARLLVVSLTEAGHEVALRSIPCAQRITEETLHPLNADERARLLALLDRLK
jgi:DNA-binding MarR family transcriptional regulator